MIRATLATYAPATWGGMAQAEILAKSRAAMYPGAVAEWVPRDGMRLGGGYWATVHPDAEGLAVTHYGDTVLPAGTTLQRRDSVRLGDVVWSSHVGVREVTYAASAGEPVGTTTLRLKVGDGWRGESYPADSLIPVISRRVAPEQMELTADEVLILTIEARCRAEQTALTVTFGQGRAILHVNPDSAWARDLILDRRAGARG